MTDPYFKKLLTFFISAMGLVAAIWAAREISDVYINYQLAQYMVDNGLKISVEVENQIRRNALLNAIFHIALLVIGVFVFRKFNSETVR